MNEFRLYPQVVVWEITFACNMRCIHCGTSAGTIRPDELNTSEALALIDELHALGTESITLSGGEPLLRKDWRLLAQRINEREITPYLITNGYAVTLAIVDDMLALGFKNVGVSLDGTEPTHNYIRQNKHCFERVLNAMRLMKERNLRFCAITQVSNINLHELDDIHEILQSVGCPIWRIQMTTPTGRMPRDMVLSLENYPRLIDKVLAFRQANNIEIDIGENIGYYGCKGMEIFHGLPYLGCYAGTRIAGIESNGNVKGCLSMPEEFVEGNIRNGSFSAIWHDPDRFVYNRRFTKDSAEGACRECRYLPLCRGGCATTSLSATGSRANNPYCVYRMERAGGIGPVEPELVTELLQQFSV